jgi:hypothetical protein
MQSPSSGGEGVKRLGGVLTLMLLVLALPVALLADPADHQDREPRPIQLGVSGGNVNDRSRLFCCSGTLGALIQIGAIQYILSNNHVLANTNAAQLGDPINQPGNIDVGCQNIPADYVANLADLKPIDFSGDNAFDAAIGQITPGLVSTNGSILEIGVPKSSPLAASIGLGVKKSGRTTGLTTGQVSTINVAVTVNYCFQCGLCLRKRPARFVGQIEITPGSFSAEGDSGSLIVENVATAPRPVALLFAGGSTSTIGSPIGPVLAAFGATLVGTASDAAEEASAGGGTTVSDHELAAAIAIQERHQEALLVIPGVAGVGIGRSQQTGQLVLRVFLERETPEVQQSLPASLEGLNVETVVTGPFEARIGRHRSSDELCALDE